MNRLKALINFKDRRARVFDAETGKAFDNMVCDWNSAPSGEEITLEVTFHMSELVHTKDPWAVNEHGELHEKEVNDGLSSM